MNNLQLSMGVNTWCNANSVSFKSHSIRVTFKICAVLGAQGVCATGFRCAQGNQHCAKFESTLIEWHLKLTLLALHQVFTPCCIIQYTKSTCTLVFALICNKNHEFHFNASATLLFSCIQNIWFGCYPQNTKLVLSWKWSNFSTILSLNGLCLVCT